MLRHEWIVLHGEKNEMGAFIRLLKNVSKMVREKRRRCYGRGRLSEVSEISSSHGKVKSAYEI